MSLSLHRGDKASIYAIGVFTGALLASAAHLLAAWLTPRLPGRSRRRAAAGPGGGRITLAGCGPGAPELLTLAAYSALADADVVISDLIAPPALRAMARPGVEFHIAEKIPGNADSAQESVNAWGLEALRRGKNVVRLKVGDPFLYGRGGEEALFYLSHGYTADVIPGVCAALAAPAVAGIPVTHRGAANQVLISTGQGRGGTLPQLSPYVEGRTLVLLMAVGRIPRLAADLSDYPQDSPVAIIERASHPNERTTRTTLENIARDAAAAGIESPAVIVIGPVVDVLQREAVADAAKRILWSRR